MSLVFILEIWSPQSFSAGWTSAFHLQAGEINSLFLLFCAGLEPRA